jgi:hypothetical protein
MLQVSRVTSRSVAASISASDAAVLSGLAGRMRDIAAAHACVVTAGSRE